MNNLVDYISKERNINSAKVDKNLLTLNMRAKLSQIVVPKNKLGMFIDWYNSDLRFQDIIPRSFDEGYLIIENDFVYLDYDSEEVRQAIKESARSSKTTYRKVEDFLKTNQSDLENLVLYFKFIDSYLNLYMYGGNSKKLLTTLIVNLDKTDNSEPNPEIKRHIEYPDVISPGMFPKLYIYYAFIILQCSMWYLATTKNHVQYYYEQKTPITKPKEKNIVNPRREKVVTTSIYDFNRIRKVKVDSLIRKRKGWTYSHAFQVHGHYRHYKDGKVIFVKSFIKGKGKEQVGQKITLSPKSIGK